MTNIKFNTHTSKSLHRIDAQGKVTGAAHYPGDLTPEVLLHALGDTRGKKAAPDAAVETTLAFIGDLLDDYFHRFSPLAAGRPLLDGQALMARFGLAPSPTVGRVLRAVEEERLAGRIATRDEAFAFAGQFLADNTDQKR